MLQNMALEGRAAWAPDVLAVLLVFWTVHQPMRVNIGAAFVFGLLMDVHQGGLLGQHAMSYSVLSYFAIAIHRRLLWFTLPSQAAQVFPLFFAAHVVELMLRMVAGGTFPGLGLLAAPVIEVVLWPLAHVVLLAPQRRAPNPDANRPL
jgi:rod shape-determining protein MreD